MSWVEFSVVPLSKRKQLGPTPKRYSPWQTIGMHSPPTKWSEDGLWFRYAHMYRYMIRNHVHVYKITR